MKRYVSILAGGMLFLAASGCTKIGEKSMSLLVLYVAAALLAILLLIGYLTLIRQKNRWFVLLFASVAVVNVGYLLLAISDTLTGALWANRLSYLGSVLLPYTMLIIILQACHTPYRPWLPWGLLAICAGVFLVTASPGYLDIYYQSISIHTFNGITILNKTYGAWHRLYLFYLLIYFVTMVFVIAQASVKHRLPSYGQAYILLSAVLINILVWLAEQLVHIEFELLSISYLITELFLLGIYLLQQEHVAHTPAVICQPSESLPPASIAHSCATATETIGDNALDLFNEEKSFSDRCAYLESQLYRLTPAEHTIYDLYLNGMGTKDVLTKLNITQNTLKYHNKNIYSKLGVSSRKELITLAKALATDTSSGQP